MVFGVTFIIVMRVTLGGLPNPASARPPKSRCCPYNTGWLDVELPRCSQLAGFGWELVPSVLDGWPQLRVGPVTSGLVGGWLDPLCGPYKCHLPYFEVYAKLY